MTRRASLILAPFALGCAVALTAASPPAPKPHAAKTASVYAAAVAAPDRPADARKLDGQRKPAQVLAWLGLKPAMSAADLMTGSGYWAEIMAHVVGPTGSVTAFEPQQFMKNDKVRLTLEDMQARVPVVTLTSYPYQGFTPAPDQFNFAIMNLNYHDLYWKSDKYDVPVSDPRAFVRALYKAMKPGGVVGIIDHVGPKGDTRAIVDKLHRIAPSVVRADFESAGFRFVGSNDMLANPQDDHTKPVFDPAIRGKTDRFILKFMKPS